MCSNFMFFFFFLSYRRVIYKINKSIRLLVIIVRKTIIMLRDDKG